MFGRKKKTKDNLSGILLPAMETQSGPNILELLGCGGLLFLIVYGTIGCYTSIFGIMFNQWLVAGILLLVDLFLGLIFYRNWMKNVGYILLFLCFLAGVLFWARYIVSGFYGLMNVTLERMGAMMNLSNVMNYNEAVPNREMAITYFFIFCGIGISTLLNALIANYTSVFGTMIVTLPIALAGLYVGLVPDLLYAVMLLAGFLILFIMKKGLSQGSHRLMRQLVLMVFLICFGFLLLANFLFPGQRIGKSQALSPVRQVTDEYVARFVSGGLLGLFNRYSGAGGMSGGKLGGVAFVNPDYETDLVVRMVPYTTDTLYLRGFTGISYNKSQWWTRADGFTSVTGEQNVNRENKLLKKKSKTKQHGKMEITNVGADTGYRYLPYYSIIEESNFCHIGDFDVITGRTPLNQPYEVTFYADDEKVTGGAKQSNIYAYQTIPDDNYEVLAKFCDDANLHAGESYDEIAKTLGAYFQKYYPYTKRPGVKPAGKDFVNYFLAESKTGYCAYYASAATLIYRYLGYEARYIEGYCIPFNRVAEGKIVNDAKVDDYFAGATLKNANYVMDVEIDDSCAHAWTEVFVPGFGWRIVDVTPASFEKEETGSSMGFLDSLFGTGGTSEQVDNSEYEMTGIDWTRYTIVGWVFLTILAIVFLGAIAILTRRRYQLYQRINNENRSLALRSRYKHLCKYMRKKNTSFAREATYEQQIGWMNENIPELAEIDSLVDILEKANFSPRGISEEEYQFAKELLEGVRKSV